MHSTFAQHQSRRAETGLSLPVRANHAAMLEADIRITRISGTSLHRRTAASSPNRPPSGGRSQYFVHTPLTGRQASPSVDSDSQMPLGDRLFLNGLQVIYQDRYSATGNDFSTKFSKVFSCGH